jgi:hypothetical protein
MGLGQIVPTRQISGATHARWLGAGDCLFGGSMKTQFLGRRTLVQLAGVCAAFLTQAVDQRAHALPAANNRATVKNRECFVAIQVKPYAWVDEGIDQLLDAIRQKGGVSTVWAYTYDYAEARMTRFGTILPSEHGKPRGPKFGGAFYDYHQKYFRNTILTDSRSSDYEMFNVIAELAPKAKARVTDFLARDYNNAVPLKVSF